MSEPHEQQAFSAIKVIDRRRFTSAGTVRDDAGPLTDAPSARFAAPPPLEGAQAPRQRSDEGARAVTAAATPEPGAVPRGRAAADAPPAAPAASAASYTESSQGADDDAGLDVAADEPRLEFLPFVASLATNALAAMGALPENQRGGIPRSPQMAREYIDIIVMLEQRTRGNLTPDEATAMKQLVADLRMQYVEITRSVQPVR